MRGCVLALLTRRVLATPLVVHANGTRTPLSDRIANEQLCEDASRFPTDPGSTRVAVILRGDAFRGLSYGTTVRNSKLPFYCDGLARSRARRNEPTRGDFNRNAAAADFHWSKNLKCGDLLGPADFAELEGWWRRHHDAATAGYDHGGFLGAEDDVEDGARASQTLATVRDAAFRDE
ncbi:GTP binding protein [Aureococcus anophagefferens]|nr:GTP binding protein [Aureococcus anophagefferens]